jgi:hypothetical protein
MQVPLAFITSTSAASTLGTSAASTCAGPQELEVLGYHSGDGRVFMLEHYRDNSGDLPQLLYMHTKGVHIGRIVPVRSWYEGASISPGLASFGAKQFGAGLADLREALEPMPRVEFHDWRLSTRVIKRRGLRVYPDQPPIRKYQLRLRVSSRSGGTISSIGAQTEVTAFLRHRAELVEVFAVPRARRHIAVLSYVGVPFEVGYDKQTALLLPL